MFDQQPEDTNGLDRPVTAVVPSSRVNQQSPSFPLSNCVYSCALIQQLKFATLQEYITNGLYCCFFFLQAELADRDFTAERYQPVVITTSAHTALAAEQSAAKRAEAEQRNAHKLHIPRRPEWDASTTHEQLDAQEKASFLEWRR